jgi:hypothetical protein
VMLLVDTATGRLFRDENLCPTGLASALSLGEMH